MKRSYPNSFGGQWQGKGYELIAELQLLENARRIAEESVALHKADQCPEGSFTLILDSTQLGLQIHESVGHPIELDRVLGMSDYFKINIGPNVKAQLKNDLELEYVAVKRLNKGVQLCVDAGDNGSRELLEKILVDEEHHIDWLEGQLHAIEEMGYENYLAQYLHEGEK